MFFSAAAIFITFLLIACLVLWKKLGGKCCLREVVGPTLLITAHPDDECMFFAPTILALTKRTSENVYLLCLSEGSYYGKGQVRRKELYTSASLLGIRPKHVQIVDDARLPDDPSTQWSLEALEQHISEAIRRHSIQTVITFDGRGVSGHSNHISVHTAVGRMCSQSKYNSVTVLLLESVGLCRKYLGPLELLSSHWASQYSIGTLPDYFKARQAMQAHWSQYVWFRKLYICFSRYMYINTLRRLGTGESSGTGERTR